MGLRTPEQFKESLKDGRRVYLAGERVDDVTTHPVLKISAETAAGSYVLANSPDPQIRALYVASHPETGEPIARRSSRPEIPRIWSTDCG